MSFSAQVVAVDPDDAQLPMVLRVKDADYGLIAIQQGPPGGVAVVAGASEGEFVLLLTGIIAWGLDAGIPPVNILRVVRATLASHGTP